MKVSKIEIDKIKQGCSCRFLAPSECRSGKKYLIEECKACIHKKGKSFVRNNSKNNPYIPIEKGVIYGPDGKFNLF